MCSHIQLYFQSNHTMTLTSITTCTKFLTLVLTLTNFFDINFFRSFLLSQFKIFCQKNKCLLHTYLHTCTHAHEHTIRKNTTDLTVTIKEVCLEVNPEEISTW